MLPVDPFTVNKMPLNKLFRITKENDYCMLKCNLQSSHMCFLMNTFSIIRSSSASNDYHNFEVLMSINAFFEILATTLM